MGAAVGGVVGLYLGVVVTGEVVWALAGHLEGAGVGSWLLRQGGQKVGQPPQWSGAVQRQAGGHAGSVIDDDDDTQPGA